MCLFSAPPLLNLKASKDVNGDTAYHNHLSLEQATDLVNSGAAHYHHLIYSHTNSLCACRRDLRSKESLYLKKGKDSGRTVDHR